MACELLLFVLFFPIVYHTSSEVLLQGLVTLRNQRAKHLLTLAILRGSLPPISEQLVISYSVNSI